MCNLNGLQSFPPLTLHHETSLYWYGCVGGPQPAEDPRQISTSTNRRAAGTGRRQSGPNTGIHMLNLSDISFRVTIEK